MYACVRAETVSRSQTTFFSLSLGREKKGLVQFESHTRLDTTRLIAQKDVMHFQIVVPASINYHDKCMMSEAALESVIH